MSKTNKQIPLSVPYLNGNEWRYVKECLDTAWVSGAGGFVKQFEEKVCKYSRAKYAVACINGTSGLQIALRLCGVKANDEVIVPSLTFIAPVNSVKYLGAEPVFIDCDEYLNLDAGKLDEFCTKECKVTKDGLKNKRSSRIIKAVVPVHVFGNPCNMEKIMHVVKKYKLKVVEDAAESIGSRYTGGIHKNRFTGTIGDFGVYSFNGNKIITSGGGGMILTNSGVMAERARYLVNQAKDDSIRYIHKEIGYNFRLSNLQAALGLAQLEQLEVFIQIKKRNYDLYKGLLNNVKGIKLMDIPAGTRPNYWFYSIIIEKQEYGMSREHLMAALSKKNIQSRPLWYPNHLQKPYRRNQAYKIERAPWFWERILNLPSGCGLGPNELRRVVSEIKNIRGKKWTK